MFAHVMPFLLYLKICVNGFIKFHVILYFYLFLYTCLILLYGLLSLWSSPIVRVINSRRMSWAGHVARMDEGGSVYRVLVRRPEGKRPLGRPRRRWEDNIKMDLREIDINGGNWFQLAQDRVQWWAIMNTVVNLRVP